MDGRILFSARDGYRNPSGIWEQGTGGWRLQGFTTFSFPPAELPKCCLSARGGFLGQQQLLLSCQSSLSNTRTNQGAEWRHCGEGRLQGPGQLSKASPSHRDIPGCSESLCPAGTAEGGDRDSRDARNGSGIRRCEFQLAVNQPEVQEWSLLLQGRNPARVSLVCPKCPQEVTQGPALTFGTSQGETKQRNKP